MRTLLFLPLAYLLVTTGYAQAIRLQPIASGFVKPVDISATGIQDDKRLFVTEKDGRIKILQPDGSVSAAPFLDIDARVNSGANERGLLGLAFHPSFKDNGYFFVHYTNASGHSTISRFLVDPANGDRALENSEKVLLVVNQPFNNHNAGDLVFGNNGYLYIGMGDGGSAGDPGNRSQNPKQLLGKMLRIDVNTENAPYLIPPTNPYRNSADTLPEIWAFGLRNPWRISVDAVSDELWIADVGQDRWEEVNVAPSEQPALNYGWRCLEGNAPFNQSMCSATARFYPPVHVYANQFSIGCSVTGGFVYRGDTYPALYGTYIYCDFCTGLFWGLSRQADGSYINQQIADAEDMEFATFGTDNAGELYVAGLGNGTVYQVQAAGSSVLDKGQSAVSVFPNPAGDVLHVDVSSSGQASDPATWLISSADHSLSVQPVVIHHDERSVQMDISALPPGMYFLRSIEGIPATRFVKM